MSENVGFTFFPDPGEREIISRASANEIADFLIRQPDLNPQLIHEILKQEKKQNLIEALIILRDSDQELIINNYMYNTVVKTVEYMGIFDVSLSDRQEFIADAADVLLRVSQSIPIDIPLNREQLIRRRSIYLLVSLNVGIEARQDLPKL